MTNSDVIRDPQKQARSKIVSTWAQVADKYTVGWGGPLEAVGTNFPHLTDATSDVRARVSPTLPLIIYQTRQSPPLSMSVAVPYDPDCKCRVVAVGELSQPERNLLGEFAQAIWFLIASGALPDPSEGNEFEAKLIELTDAKSIFEIVGAMHPERRLWRMCATNLERVMTDIARYRIMKNAA